MNRPPISLVGTFALVGFLLVVTGTTTEAVSESQAPRREALISQILQSRTDVSDLDRAVAELRDQVIDAQQEAGNASQLELEKDRAEQALALSAGTTAVKGPGIIVTLSDAQRPNSEDRARFDASRIQDGDLQLVVNALFESGAEAVSINGNRVVAVTPIRAAGGTVVVNYRPVSSPYRIAAIGVDSKRFSSSEIARHFKDWEDKFDLGYDVQTSRNVTVPGYSGRVGIEVARAQVAVPTPTGER